MAVIGIHTPETEAEKDINRVRKKMDEAGFKFPIAIDNKTTMWHKYSNSYWPSVYLIDKQGVARWGWASELCWKGAKGDVHMRAKIVELLKQ